MKKLLTLTAVLLAGMVCIAHADAAKAKALYTKECAKCHGPDGKGDTKMGKKAGAKDYSNPKVQAELKDDKAFKAIKEGLKEDGKTVMKPLEGVSDDEIKALVKHMRTFKK
ncbi:MAG TPA: cytochrome c [Verrucomicrobiota bacterium]|jgi:cytochrome c553|nr:cytochrome c [Verrucomicrobiota bacterium]OQB93796.1 MAG: Cytochrome c [Verrucomicrobia bacterium ADurb.Bin118]HPY30914.1 cytochrome c [Verrucomicrobiota bacterium]HQB17376.1 cytochrome c [Verrucomicrobiota bacterium]